MQAICEKVVVISKGRIVANDTPHHLATQLANESKFVARICGPASDVLRAVKELDGVLFAELQNQMEGETADYLIESQPGIDVRKPLFYLLAQRSWPLIGLKNYDMSLEDIFMELVDHSSGEGEKA